MSRRMLSVAAIAGLGVVAGAVTGVRGFAQARAECHPSYPDVCIPPPPPDLDCGDLDECDIRVVGSDPHRLDRDHDGIACECR